MQAKTSIISIIGIVLAIISLLIAFIPCIGTLALIPAIIAVILSIIGYNQDKNGGASTTAAITGIVCGALALLVSGGQTFFLGKAGSEIATEVKVEYENCDELLSDFQKTIDEMSELKNMNEDDMQMSEISKLIRTTAKIASIKTKAGKMGCEEDEEFAKKMEEISSVLED